MPKLRGTPDHVFEVHIVKNERDVPAGTRSRGSNLVREHAEGCSKAILSETETPKAVCSPEGCSLHLCRGLAFLHGIGCLHADLKPANCLWFEDDKVCKLADLGCVRFLWERASAGRVVTIAYRSIELLLGSTRLTPALDIWSFGCTLAEMLLGQPLFSHEGTWSEVVPSLQQVLFDSDLSRCGGFHWHVQVVEINKFFCNGFQKENFGMWFVWRVCCTKVACLKLLLLRGQYSDSKCIGLVYSLLEPSRGCREWSSKSWALLALTIAWNSIHTGKKSCPKLKGENWQLCSRAIGLLRCKPPCDNYCR